MQKAAAYHEGQNRGADYCGRYAWTQGPIVGTGQYYPRDFNLVALSGSVTDMRDAQGPVAASQAINIGYFRANYGEADPIAFIANSMDLGSGEVFGAARYASLFSARSVTFYPSTARPVGPTVPLPINFSEAAVKLNAMSQALRAYTPIPDGVKKQYSTMTFTGTDAELNVFEVRGNGLYGDTYSVTDYLFNVPPGSRVIINNTNQLPVIQNAGFRGTFAPDKILWNFPVATSLTVRSIGLPGSILAPKANAQLTNGHVKGTVVVKSAIANVELYTAPFQVPGVGGCLTFDPTWSCSGDTLNDDQGRAAFVADEAGFLQLAGGTYRAEWYPPGLPPETIERKGPTHRVWYSFHPAKKSPETKPLAVLFNGGPGSATSCWLAAFNTGPKKLDIMRTRFVENPDSWTDFANLLYIDAPGAGFSYPLRDPANPEDEPDLGLDPDRDAGNFLRVVLRFLERHPTLRKNRVILVGESYAGVRSVLMLKYLLNHQSVGTPTSSYYDPQLREELDKHFDAVFGRRDPSQTQVLMQFGHQVLIQGLIGGTPQAADDRDWPLYEDSCLSPHCWRAPLPDQPACDGYKCDEVPGWMDNQGADAVETLTALSNLQSVLGVNPRTIAWMHADKRVLAYGREDGHYLPDTSYLENPAPEMIDYFGALDDTDGHYDTYFVASNQHAHLRYALNTPQAARYFVSEEAGLVGIEAFVEQTWLGAHTFITEAALDAAVFPRQIPSALDHYRAALGNLYNESFFWATMDIGLPRWGALQISWAEKPTQFVTMPVYQHSGHSVPMSEPYFLKPDVETWYHRSLE